MFKTYQLNDLEQIASNATRNLFFKNEWVPMPEIKRGTKCIFVVFSGNFGVIINSFNDCYSLSDLLLFRYLKEYCLLDQIPILLLL